MTTGQTGMPIILPAVLDLSAAESFLAMMLQAGESEEPVRLDASAVETITLPCVQIILAAKRADGRLTVANPTDAFLSAFADLGLSWEDGAAPRKALPPPEQMVQEPMQQPTEEAVSDEIS